ncbi:MAG: hypothetical protein MUO52_08850, partial [Desulfobacterales bacterium]|nr:hypothetical protein [Desulfobacterales bacterium]
TNGKSDTYGCFQPFALRYRRVNGTFYECINVLGGERDSGIIIVSANPGVNQSRLESVIVLDICDIIG